MCSEPTKDVSSCERLLHKARANHYQLTPHTRHRPCRAFHLDPMEELFCVLLLFSFHVTIVGTVYSTEASFTQPSSALAMDHSCRSQKGRSQQRQTRRFRCFPWLSNPIALAVWKTLNVPCYPKRSISAGG